MRQGGAAGALYTGQVGVDDPFEHRRIEGGHRCDGVDAGAGDDDVEATEMGCGTGERGLKTAQVTHVGAPAVGHGVRTQSTGLFLRLIGVEVEQREVGAAGSQRFGEGGAKASGGACDGDGAPGQVVAGHALGPFGSVWLGATWVVRNRIWSATTRSKASAT